MLKNKVGLGFLCGVVMLTTLSAKSISSNIKTPIDSNRSHFVPTDIELFDANGNKVSHRVLGGKYVGIYFSAPWCGPCKPFTKHLRSFRQAFGDSFEVVFVSMDKEHSNVSEETLKKKYAYMKSSKMPWYTINIKYETAKQLLLNTRRSGIPTLIVFSPTGNYVTNEGRVDIQFKPNFPSKLWGN